MGDADAKEETQIAATNQRVLAVDIFEYNPAVILPPSTTRCTIASTWNVAGGVFTLQGQHFLEDLEFGWAWVETPAQPISDK